MKKISLIVIGVVALFSACTKHQKVKKEERTIIAPFHITKVMMRPVDSTEAGQQVSLSYDQVFLNKDQFALFEKNVWALFKDSTSKIYQGADPTVGPMNKKEFLEERKGWDLRHITTLDCYETWYFNPQNNMIERDVLGYAIFEYVPDKLAYRILGYIFKDEAARKKVNENYLSWD